MPKAPPKKKAGAKGKPPPSMRAKPVKPKRKRGRPTVLTAERKREILAILTIGGSRNDAADYVGIDRSTLETAKLLRSHGAFCRQVKKAEAAGKAHHMRKVHTAEAWQASAWMLERKYPDEFGRKYQPSPESAAVDASGVPERKYVYEIVTTTHKRP